MENDTQRHSFIDDDVQAASDYYPACPPITFPRSQWLRSVLTPPFHESQLTAYVAWSAQQASWCWSRCTGNTAPQPSHLSAPHVLEVVDEVCFKLAMLDKILEVLTHIKVEQISMAPKHVLTWEEYVCEIEDMMDRVYDWAVSELPPDSPTPPPLRNIASFLRSALYSWSTLVCIKKRPSREDLFAPPGVTPSPCTAPLKALCVEDLGRFAAKYYTVSTTAFWLGSNGEIVTEPVLRKAEPLPEKLKPQPQKAKPLPRNQPSTPRTVPRTTGPRRTPLGSLTAVGNTQSPVRTSAQKKGATGTVQHA